MTRAEIVNKLIELESIVQKADFIINNFVHVDDIFRPLAKTVVYRMLYTGGFRMFRAIEFKNGEPSAGVQIDAEMYNHIIDSGMGKEHIFKKEKFDVVVNPYNRDVAIILNNDENEMMWFASVDEWDEVRFNQGTYAVHYHYDTEFTFSIYPIENEVVRHDNSKDKIIHTVFNDEEYHETIARILNK